MYELIDNFLDKKELESVERVLLSGEFPWYLSPVVGESWNTKDNIQFSHSLYSKDHVKSEWLHHFGCLLDRMNIFTLLRIKINYLPRTEKIVTHDFHIDIEDSNAPKNINTSIFYCHRTNNFRWYGSLP